jgi:hypothetical protein
MAMTIEIAAAVANVVHTQASPTQQWVIQHGLNTSAPIVDVWVSNGSGGMNKIIPASVKAITPTVCHVTFTVATAGVAYVK